MGSPPEPTQLVQLFNQHQTQLRNERLRNTSGRTGEKRPYGQRLTFDDTLNESGNSSSKLARLQTSSFMDSSSRRITNNETARIFSKYEEQIKSLEQKLKDLTAENAGNLGRKTKLETRLIQTELEMKKMKLESDQKIDKINRMYKTEMERASDLKFKLKKLEDRQLDHQEINSESRRESLDRVDSLETKVRVLRETRSKLEGQNDRLQTQLRNRANIDPQSFSRKVQNYENTIGDMRQQLNEYEEKNKRLTAKLEENIHLLAEHKETKDALARSKLNVEKLECELAANRESVIQRKAMSHKLDQFSHLEKENISLRNINDLQTKTQENVALLKEQISTLTSERDGAESRARDRQTIRADLDLARDEIQEWKELVGSVATVEQRRVLANSGVNTGREILKHLHNRELELVTSKQDLNSQLNQANSLIERGKQILHNKDTELDKIKDEQNEQAKLIKKLQRKLLLVSKERDTSRAILDSFEKELTVSGSSWEEKRIEGLEKTLEEYKAMINMLMENEGSNQPLTLPVPSVKNEEFVALENAKEVLEARVDELEQQLELKALRGDYNPDETRVLHFINNPMDNATKRREVDIETLKTENVALKTRIQLLEEGQTRDLTLMVGQKVEDGASSEEVEKLTEKLKSADLKNQRIMEAFTKTSKEFRTLVGLTTGYRVDSKGDGIFKLRPYLCDKNQYLLFSISPEDEVNLLETDFSQSLGVLMEKHLEENNSIPMFLSALMMKLWRKQHGEDSSESGEESEEREESDNDEQIDDDRASEVICVDDD